MSVEFEISEVFPASPEAVYGAWLDSEGHAAMTGSPAVAGGAVGGEFQAWDGYITGKHLELTPVKLLRQAWRTPAFAESDRVAALEIDAAVLAHVGGADETATEGHEAETCPACQSSLAVDALECPDCGLSFS